MTARPAGCPRCAAMGWDPTPLLPGHVVCARCADMLHAQVAEARERDTLINCVYGERENEHPHRHLALLREKAARLGLDVSQPVRPFPTDAQRMAVLLAPYRDAATPDATATQLPLAFDEEEHEVTEEESA